MYARLKSRNRSVANQGLMVGVASLVLWIATMAVISALAGEEERGAEIAERNAVLLDAAEEKMRETEERLAEVEDLEEARSILAAAEEKMKEADKRWRDANIKLQEARELTAAESEDEIIEFLDAMMAIQLLGALQFEDDLTAYRYADSGEIKSALDRLIAQCIDFATERAAVRSLDVPSYRIQVSCSEIWTAVFHEYGLK